MCELIPIPNEFDDINDFWPHPVYDRYEANREGLVRHVVNKKDIGYISNIGYFRIDIRCMGNRKRYLKHRFIFECFHGKINDAKLVVDHINNIKTDNRLKNLQLITHSQNMKKDHRKGKGLPIMVRAINIKSGEAFNYESIGECARRLDIIHTSIHRVLNGIANTATSKKDNNKYTFERL